MTYGDDVDQRGGLGRTAHVAILCGLLLLGFTYLNALAAVNLGEIGALVVLLALLPAYARDRRLPGSIALVMALWVSFAGVVPYSEHSSYGTEKIHQLFTIALLAVAGGVLLLRTTRSREIWLTLVVALGIVVAAAAYLVPSKAAAEQAGRLAVEGGSAISAGRAAGGAAVVLISLALSGASRRWVALGSAVALLLAVVDSGSRGPLIAATIALLVVALVPHRQKGVRLALLAGVGGLSYYLATQSSYSTDRFTDAGISGENRVHFWRIAWDEGVHNPLGLGWGGLQAHIFRTYPHDVVLEAWAEGGCLAGVLLTVTLVTAVVVQVRAARRGPVEMAMLGLLVFLLVNALVSSDIPGNRGLWVMVGAALVARFSDVGDDVHDTVGSLPDRPEGEPAEARAFATESDLDRAAELVTASVPVGDSATPARHRCTCPACSPTGSAAATSRSICQSESVAPARTERSRTPRRAGSAAGHRSSTRTSGRVRGRADKNRR